jgi:hypothetical protein
VTDIRREWYYLDRVRKLIPLTGAAVKSEPPDFIIERNDGPLGIEFTVFHLPPIPGSQPHRETHSLKWKVVRLAQRIHADAGGPALYVSSYFSPWTRLTKADVEPLAQTLARAVLSAPVPTSIAEATIELGFGELPAEIFQVTVHGSVDGIDRLWQPGEGGWVAPISADHIQDAIGRKETTAAVARGKCSELWLVIVNDVFVGAPPAELTSTAETAQYSSSFDRVLWLNPHIPQLHEFLLAN